jgi:hypothetical protein
LYSKWIEWQEDAALDSQLSRMRKKRKDILIKILCIQHQRDILYQQVAKLDDVLREARVEHSKLDLNLALIDGRFSCVKEPKTTVNNSKVISNLKSLLAGMSKQEIAELTSQLQAL